MATIKAVTFDSNETPLDPAALEPRARAPDVRGRDLADVAEQVVRGDA